MARSWGDGGPTQTLHRLAFDKYEELAKELGCTTYRKLPVLSVSPGYDGIGKAKKDKMLGDIIPNWLDGKVGRISCMGYGDDTAQITPKEFVTKMIDKCQGDDDDNFNVVLGTCCGIETEQGSERGTRKVVGVKYNPVNGDDEEQVLAADAVIVSAGPWSCQAEDWFHYATDLQLPMEGIKSTSIVWKDPTIDNEGSIDKVDATALFCGENNKYGTHCKFFA